MKPTTPRVHGLDTLRSLAIIVVILFHIAIRHDAGTLPDVIVPAVQMGWMGVDLFFVLSGYLIGSQLLRSYQATERPRLWDFYRNRLYRVLPAYLAVLALYFCVPVWRELNIIAPLCRFLTFTFNLVPDLSISKAFSHVWSLCIEEHFYLLLPLITMLMMRKPSLRKTVTLFAALVLSGIGYRTFILLHSLQPMGADDPSFGLVYLERIYFPTYSRLDGLLAGLALALICTFRPQWWSVWSRRGHTMLCLGLALVGIAIWLFNDRWDSVTGTSAWGTAIGFPLLSLGLGLIVASALSQNGILSRVKVPGAKLIATLAYSLYLTHKELIHLVDLSFPALFQTGRYPWLAVYAALCLLVATALYLCVERPFLRLRNRPSPLAVPSASPATE